MPLAILIIVVLAMNFVWSGGNDRTAPPPIKHNGSSAGQSDQNDLSASGASQESPGIHALPPSDSPLPSPSERNDAGGNLPSESPSSADGVVPHHSPPN